MKILFIADHLKFGGAERHLVTVATGMKALGNEVAVAYMKPCDELSSELHNGGVSLVICCNSRGSFDPGAIRRLAALICEFRPNVLISTSQYSLAMAALARLWARHTVSLLFICHSMDVVRRNRSDRLRFAVYRHFYRMAERIVFVSVMQRQFFRQLGIRPRSDEVIHNGIDLNRFSVPSVAIEASQLRRAFGFTDSDLVIGMCAVFREEKCQIDLLEALRRLRDKQLPAKVLLVGDGIMRPQIEARRDELGLQDAVVLSGFQQDVRPYVAACDIMALTSHAETFPIATLEYMALGKPLVASNVGGLCEQITDGHNGLMYPAGDIDALSDQLMKLADRNTRTILGSTARDVVETKFSLGRMIDSFQATCKALSTKQLIGTHTC
ncbi:glycosyltransferase [Dechloromonas denitrificans]|uniref:glycosyltransferase n=1 Tax=Dechloromonas denitrificans TaxID=281362 RepID=UPI001CF8CC44|nr:glycosyltransferase [Dechloromonas denitrificans]UCV05490.1 glycosyltransferase [Dechloromonas denitrificans]UCV09836.1 glycosyltransferase [Dechloromonas denitrificans]